MSNQEEKTEEVKAEAGKEQQAEASEAGKEQQTEKPVEPEKLYSVLSERIHKNER